MKCYKHPKIDAVGVCSECGKGICEKCAVEIGGKLYCKSDADRVFGTPMAQAAPVVTKAPQTSASVERNSVLGQSSLAWILCIAGLFILPPICFGLGAILGYSALTKATDNLNIFSTRDVVVCGIGAFANVILFFWWAIRLVGLL